jgi:hypothetical protein
MYKITIHPNGDIQIGCKCYSKDKWLSFSDSDLIEMGGDYAPLLKQELLKELDGK